MKVVHIVGARPNFMKVAPVMRALRRHPAAFDQVLIHTGQHYDFAMSQVFFQDLALPEPDHYLGVGSGSHAEQTGRVMMALEPVVEELQPDLVIVVGDVNSTLAGALVCGKLGVPVAHVEAGLRSGDRSMPEELNRLLTDQVAELLFTHSRKAGENLVREGVHPDKIHFVGNVMVDSLVEHLPLARQKDLRGVLGLPDRPYVLTTLHRPANVDNAERLAGILGALVELAADTLVVLVLHPRTRGRVAAFGLDSLVAGNANLVVLDPQGYLDFLALILGAAVVLTDSGGIQEETTYLGLPCLTLRPNTERPITIEEGTNRLIGATPPEIIAAVTAALDRESLGGKLPELWDGQAAGRIASVVGNLA